MSSVLVQEAKKGEKPVKKVEWKRIMLPENLASHIGSNDQSLEVEVLFSNTPHYRQNQISH